VGAVTRVTRAVARVPGANAGEGLTTSILGAPDIPTMLQQHRAYVEAMESRGVLVTVLEADERFPDGSFVEDTAVVLPEVAVITRPGAPSRQGEEANVEDVLAGFRQVARIEAPGCMDGGDVLAVGDTVFIGLSERTNEEGAAQLSAIIGEHGLRAVPLATGDGLHLKSSINWLGENRLLVTRSFARTAELGDFERIVVPDDESYAANSLWLNDRLLVPSGFPKAADLLDGLGLDIMTLDVSEFEKMDGGLTCLSLRI
jgi:dimethylargininase